MGRLYGEVFQALVETWERDSSPPQQEKNYLRATLATLLDENGGVEWVMKHPHLLQDEALVFHAAGFRSEEMRRYASVLIMQYREIRLYLRPDDVRLLMQIESR